MTYDQWLEGQTTTTDQPAVVHHVEDDRRSLPRSRRCRCGAAFYGSDTEQRLDLAGHIWVANGQQVVQVVQAGRYTVQADIVDAQTSDAVADAVASGEILDLDHVRRVASWWHGGQWSALYALYSTGHVDWERLESEIDQIQGDDGLAMAAWWETLDPPS